MLGISSLSKKLFGSANDRQVKTLMPLVQKVNALEPETEALSDAELRAKTDEFKARHTAGETLDDLLPEAFAVVREAARRTLGMRPFDVQIVGGIILHNGNIAEMKTGEGKTLVATLPCYLNALSGKAVHVVTVNDYLARRDAEWMGQVHNFLGLEVGVVVPQQENEEKVAAYKADITYATNNELGFDYLRDNLKSRLDQMVQRDHGFVVVDEVDSILIDEARTPLIISGPTEDKTDLYTSINELIPHLEDEHYEIDEKLRTTTLTESGNDFVERRLHADGHLTGEASLWDPESASLVHHVTQALRAHKLFTRDKDYIVRDNEVVLIDEFTGRMMSGRRLSEGLHQALEAKEGAKIQPENVTLASVTFQNYFRLYGKLAGMTGTALTEAEEFGEIYGLGVIEVPTNLPILRNDADDQVYRTVAEKYDAIVEALANAQAKGQPVLVGTTSIEKSELISGFLKDSAFMNKVADRLDQWKGELKPKEEKRRAYLERASAHLRASAKNGGMPHQVLNARFHEQEAKIVAEAGEPGTITIATNMAGRGTDIQLGGNLDMQVQEAVKAAGEEADEAAIRAEIAPRIASGRDTVLEAGGLFVLGTERHESRRIDNQLRGRSGRQGDPGKSRFYLSLEDDLMRIFGSDRLDKMLQRLGMKEGEAIVSPWVNKALEKAQGKVEARNFDARKNVLKYDDVMNDQRKAIFEQRREIMESEDLSEIVRDMRHEVAADLVKTHMPPKQFADQWDIEGLYGESIRLFGGEPKVMEWAAEEGVDDEVILDRLIAESDKIMAQKAAKYGPETWRTVEKEVVLQTIDQHWRDHLLTLEHLRSVIGLRGYAQRDPLNEYKSEAFQLFESLLNRLRTEVTGQLAHVQIMTAEEQQRMVEQLQAIAAKAGSVDQNAGDGDDVEPDLASMSAAIADSGDDAETQVLRDPADPASWGKVGRNERCPCGSGKKYKQCHGRL